MANDDTTTTAEDTPVTVGVLVNDTDVDGNLDPTTLSVTGGPTNGGAIVNPDQTITYTPNGNYSGVDSFTYQVCDTAGACDTATVTVTVTPANDQPQAVDDTATTGEDTPVTITVLANDTDPDIGDILSVTLVGTPTNGSTGTNGTTATYTPTLGFVGTDWFTYTVSDGSLTDTATVTVTVNPVNNPPVAADDTAITPEDTPVTIDVLTNDTDPDIGDILSVASVGMPANGTASTNGTTATYTPTLNFNGTDAFTYTVSDGSLTDTATVTVTVNPVNDPPVATGDAYSTNQDTPLTVAAPGVLGNDSDADSDPLTAITVTNPAGGVLAFNADGSFTYTPNAGFVGMDSFTYQANDGTVNSNIATVTINVIDTPPASPTNLRAAAGDNKIILGWDPNAEVDLAGYRVYRSDGGPFANTFTTTLTSHLDLTVTNGMIYSYTVTAFDMANNESTPSNVAVAQPYDITPYTYTTNVTCGGATVQNCSDAAGPPDDVEANITGTGVITFDFGLGTGIIDGPGYDMVFYENQNGPGIRLDYTQIELSADGVNWYTVFEWNGESPGDVMGTNIDAYAIDANGELENETIPSADLYPGGLPLNTGIAIDIGSVQPPLPPPGYSYRFVRFTFPSGGTDAAEIDAVRRLN